GQCIGKHIEHLKYVGKDTATLSAEAIGRFEKKWADLSTRMEIVPGKQVLKLLRSYVDEKWGITLTDVKIIDEFHHDEIPHDLTRLLHRLEQYRVSTRALAD
ncbi:MAG: hypothetical protein ACREX0_05545, partial [Noviherbaspirillum sp.]